MRIDVYHHFEKNEINQKLDQILTILGVIRQEETKMALDLTALTAEVDRAVTVEEGTATLVAYIVAELEASKTDPAAIQALADKLKGGTDGLSAAVANVPPEDAPPTV